jgi:hypothetical protein
MAENALIRRAPLLLILALAVAPVAGALTLEELAGPAAAALLRAGESITQVQLKDPSPALAPRHAGVRAVLDQTLQELGSGILAETLTRYEKPATATRPAWSEAERSALYNMALGLSTLQGIQYYSVSHKGMRTFYDYSRIIDSPETKRELPDPSYPEPPASISLYARQRDLSFGDNIYRYRYLAEEDHLIFIQENITAMKVGIITAVGQNRLRSLVAVIDCEDSLLVYAASLARASSFPGLGQRIGSSFTNRAQAILDWFNAQATQAFAATGTLR